MNYSFGPLFLNSSFNPVKLPFLIPSITAALPTVSSPRNTR